MKVRRPGAMLAGNGFIVGLWVFAISYCLT